MANIDKSKPVLVTGGSGYIASWIVKRLLDQGLNVHATVRNLEDQFKVAHLHELAAEVDGRLHLFEADLLNPGSFDASMASCELVIHTASPFHIRMPDDPETEFIRPAREGTRNVLDSANRAESVKRVVLTSSVAAIAGDYDQPALRADGTYTEKDWNTTSEPDHGPYAYSKTVAEKAAWEMTNAQDRWDLVVINPAGIFGPSLSKRDDFQSTQLLLDSANGTMANGTVPVEFGFVDVRDCAAAHITAGFSPGANGRYILSKQSVSVLNLADMLRAKFGDGYPFPKREVPKALLWLIAPTLGTTRKIVRHSYGIPFRLDNTRSIEELGVSYRPVEESIVEHFQQILDDGLLAAHGS